MAKEKSKKEETKAQAFVRVANLRVPKALKAIKLLGNLGSANYERTQAQADAITKALQDAVSKVSAALKPGSKVEAEPEFKL